MNNIEIQTNKTRIAFLMFIHILSLILGVFTVYYIYINGFISVTLIMVLSVFLLISPILLYLNLKIIFKTESGLIINDKGILDNIQMTKFGLIEWRNVKGFRTTKMFFSDILLLDVIDNDALMKNLSKRQKNNAENSLKKFGTPCAINLSNLKYEKDELLKLINEQIKKQIK